jgi:hypothetical protein
MAGCSWWNLVLGTIRAAQKNSEKDRPTFEREAFLLL